MKYRIGLASAILLVASAGAFAQSETRPADQEPVHPDQHTVAPGDTLWDLSHTFYQNPWFWPRIWYANPPIENPHLIFPGQVFAIPNITGSPEAILASTDPAPGAVSATVDSAVVEVTSPASASAVSAPAGASDEPKVVEVATDSPYEPVEEEEITVETPQEVATRSRLQIVQKRAPAATMAIRQVGDEEFLVDKDELKNRPRFIQPERLGTMFAEGDEIWINRGSGDVVLGQRLLAARQRDTISSDRTGKELGHLMQPTAIVEVVDVRDEISRIRIVESYDALQVDDVIFDSHMAEDQIASAPAEKDIQGDVVSAAYGVKISADWQRIFIDVGEDDGVKRGDILMVYRQRADVSDGERNYKIPPKVIGSVVVVSTNNNGATALVLNARDAVETGDYVRTPGL